MTGKTRDNPDGGWSSLPPAGAERTSFAREHFSIGLSPEEYVARNAHKWLPFSLDDYSYADDNLHQWIYRVGDILFGRNGAQCLELRKKYLTSDEIREAEEHERDP